MADKENELGHDRNNNHNNHSLQLLKEVKEEPLDDCGEGMDKDSLILDLKTRLIECEQRARLAELELQNARESAMEWMTNCAESDQIRVSAEQQLQKEKEEAARSAKAPKIEKRRLEEELEKSKIDLDREREERVQLEESLKKEKAKERSVEIGETKNCQAELTSENEDLQDQVKNLTERLESLEFSLTEARSNVETLEARPAQFEKELAEQKERSEEEESRLRAANNWAEKELKNLAKEQKEKSGEEESRLRAANNWAEKELKKLQTKIDDARVTNGKLKENLEEMRNINDFLATTPSRKINDELIRARKRIEYLEKFLSDITGDKMPLMDEGPFETVERRRRYSRVVVKTEENEEPPLKKSSSEFTK